MRCRHLGRHLVAAPLFAASLLGGSVFTAGCADPKESSLCPAYERYLSELADLVALDPEVVVVQDAIDQVDAIESAVDQLGEAGDDRHGDEVDAMSLALEDLRRTLESIDPGQDYEVWRPLIDDSLVDVADAARQLQQSLDPECRPGS
jgi:hypothetical protein